MTDFAQKMTDILNYGALNLALAIGYKNRIFDTLQDLNRPATAREIADASGLDERYLKEWLAIMGTGGIMEMEKTADGTDAYSLPAAHAAFLTRKAGSSNMGVYAQEIPMLTACALEAVNQGFHTGEGIPFSRYPDFQQFMSQLANAKHEQTLVQQFLPSVENGKLVEAMKNGIRVCDLGCGEGVAVNLMARSFPQSRFVGIDNHAEALEKGRHQARETGLSNVSYECRDAARIHGSPEFEARFDYVCAFDAIHDQSHPLAVLKGIRHMLAPGGRFSLVDIKAHTDPADNREHPMAPFLYTVSLMHCMPVGLNDKGTGLGMMWGREQATAMLEQAGFEEIDVLDIPHDGFNLHFLCRRPK